MGLCPPGTQATVDMRFCEPCKGDDFNLVAGGVCRPCPMGAKCTAGNRLEALPDWWCVPVRFACRPSAQASIFCGRRASNTSAVLFSCPMHSSCQSGPDAGDHACAVGCVLHAPCLLSGRFTPEGLVAVTLVQCVQFAVLAITPGVRFA